jgi:hypothetical protein
VLALVAYAQELAGTEPPSSEQVRDEQTLPRASPLAAPLSPSRPIWGGNNRPGVHDVLTWEEVMRIPWINGNESS